MSKKAVLLVWIIIASALLIFASSSWPPMGGDADRFMPPCITYARDHSLTNVFDREGSRFDPKGLQRFVYHGFLFQMLIGVLLIAPKYSNLFIILAIFNILTLALSLPIFMRAVKEFPKRSPWPAFLVSGALLGCTTYVHGSIGRPETFILLLLCVSMNILNIIPFDRHWFVIGSTIGMAATAHPVACVLIFCLSTAYLAYRCSPQSFLMNFFKLSVISTVLILSVFLVYPYSFSDWINGLMAHYFESTALYMESSFSDYWLFSTNASFYALVYLLGICSAVYLWVTNRAKIRTKAIFYLSTGAFLFFGYFFGVRNIYRNYNILMFSPMVYALTLYALADWNKRAASSARVTALSTAVVFIFLLSSLGFIRDVVLFYDNLKHGVPYSKVYNVVESLRQKPEQPSVGLSKNFFLLAENYQGINMHDIFYEEDNKLKPDYLVVQQVYTGWRIPPKFSGYRLIEDSFSRSVPRFMGIKIANITRSYNFALYQKE